MNNNPSTDPANPTAGESNTVEFEITHTTAKFPEGDFNAVIIKYRVPQSHEQKELLLDAAPAVGSDLGVILSGPDFSGGPALKRKYANAKWVALHRRCMKDALVIERHHNESPALNSICPIELTT